MTTTDRAPDEPQPWTPFAPGLTMIQFLAVLGAMTALFLFLNGPIWSHPWDADASILWSYAPIPLIVLALQLRNRSFRAGRWIGCTMLIAIAKYVLTATVLITCMAVVKPPAPRREPPRESPRTASRPALRAPADSEPAPTRFTAQQLGALRIRVADSAGAPVPNAFVAVTAGLESFIFPTPREPLDLAVGAGAFDPKIAAMTHRQVLRVRSADHAMHTMFAADMQHRALLNLPVLDEIELQLPSAPQRVLVSCAAHPDETAMLFFFHHPFFGRTDALGSIRMNDVPAGALTVGAFTADRRAGKSSVVVAGGGEGEAEIRLAADPAMEREK